MPWFIYALLGALGDAGYYTLVKKYVQKIDRHTLASGIYLTIGCIALAISLVEKSIPVLTFTLVQAAAVTVGLNFIASLLIYRALQLSDLSLTLPLKSLTPLFSIVTSYIILRELPTFLGVLGIIVVIIGTYILNGNNQDKGIIDPFKNIVADKGVRLMFIVVIIFSVSANFDKIVVKNSNPLFALCCSAIPLGIMFLITALVSKGKEVFSLYRKYFLLFVIIAFISVIGGIGFNKALSMQIVPYVTAVKRLSALFGVLFGWWFFREQFIGRRIVGAIIMVGGIVLIILS